MPSELLTPGDRDLERLTEMAPELAIHRAAPLLVRLAREETFVGEVILPLLEVAREVEDWYVAHRHEGKRGSFSLQVFVWPPGSRTQIHDHTTWGTYCCVMGAVLEERYERLDDGSRPDHARLKKIWQLTLSEDHGASTVLPQDEGIHRVGNPGESTAISVHLYGPQRGKVDGRDYDPLRDYVCDRLEA